MHDGSIWPEPNHPKKHKVQYYMIRSPKCHTQQNPWVIAGNKFEGGTLWRLTLFNTDAFGLKLLKMTSKHINIQYCASANSVRLSSPTELSKESVGHGREVFLRHICICIRIQVVQAFTSP